MCIRTQNLAQIHPQLTRDVEVTSIQRHFDAICLLGHNQSVRCLVMTVVNTHSNVSVLGK